MPGAEGREWGAVRQPRKTGCESKKGYKGGNKMLLIHKVTSDSVVDFAAEELRKYLRMMMPECGDVKIRYAPDATAGFRLGLMQDFGLDVTRYQGPESRHIQPKVLWGQR